MDAKIRPTARRLTTGNLESLAIQLELLMGNKPQWQCMDDMKEELKTTLTQMEVARAKFKLDFKGIPKPDVGDIAEEKEFCRKWVGRL